MKERMGDYWHPLSVPNTQQKKGANSSNKCFFIHNEDKNSQGKKHEKDAKPGKAKIHRNVGMYFSEHRIST